MHSADTLIALSIAMIAVGCVLCTLHALTRFAERERTIIDLRAKVKHLRVQYADQLAEAARKQNEH